MPINLENVISFELKEEIQNEIENCSEMRYDFKLERVEDILERNGFEDSELNEEISFLMVPFERV